MFLRPPEPLRSGMMLLGCGSSGAGDADPTPGAFDYLRPDGTSYYNRPDGTSYYLRP